MKIEELLHCSAAQLEAMTDQELLNHFKDLLPITRPEQAVRTKHTTYTPEQLNPKLKQGMDLLKGMGIDIGNSLDPMKRSKKK